MISIYFFYRCSCYTSMANTYFIIFVEGSVKASHVESTRKVHNTSHVIGLKQFQTPQTAYPNQVFIYLVCVRILYDLAKFDSMQ
jgi:hypothetical protein